MVYSLYANQLYSDDNTEVNNAGISTPVAVVEAGQEVTAETTLKVQKPNKWSAEKPYLYTLVGELKDKKGRTLETVSTHIGFRKVEIKDTPASEDEFGDAPAFVQHRHKYAISVFPEFLSTRLIQALQIFHIPFLSDPFPAK